MFGLSIHSAIFIHFRLRGFDINNYLLQMPLHLNMTIFSLIIVLMMQLYLSSRCHVEFQWCHVMFMQQVFVRKWLRLGLQITCFSGKQLSTITACGLMSSSFLIMISLALKPHKDSIMVSCYVSWCHVEFEHFNFTNTVFCAMSHLQSGLYTVTTTVMHTMASDLDGYFASYVQMM